jgi:hypothetical protein
MSGFLGSHPSAAVIGAFAEHPWNDHNLELLMLIEPWKTKITPLFFCIEVYFVRMIMLDYRFTISNKK